MEEAPVRSAPQAVEELQNAYEEFVHRLEKCRAATISEAMTFFFRGQGNPKVAIAVEEFDEIITGQVDALAGLLAECTAEEADRLAAQALDAMLFYPVPKDNTVMFSLAAFEGRAHPLIAFLSPDQRQETAKRYAKRTPPRRMLPNQKKLWKELSR